MGKDSIVFAVNPACGGITPVYMPDKRTVPLSDERTVPLSDDPVYDLRGMILID